MGKVAVEFYNINTNASFVIEGSNLERIIKAGQEKAVVQHHWLPEDTDWETEEIDERESGRFYNSRPDKNKE